MTHTKIGSRVIGTKTLCRLLGCTETQLRDAEADGLVRKISERESFGRAYERCEKKAADMYFAGRREPLSDAEVRDLWAEAVAELDREEEEIFTASVSASELAEVLRVTDRWVREMAERGILPRNEDGTFPFAHALACYMNFKRDGRR
jgi:hypothetical protein